MGGAVRVSVLRAAGDLEVQERPDPDLSPHEVWVRVSSVGVCGSDIHYFEHGRIGRFTVDAPLVLGHEASGEVVRLGSAVSRLTLGQRVSLEPGVPDFTCSQCLAGRYNLCTGMRFFATPPIDGAFAELVTIHEQFAHPAPDHLSDDAAAMLEPLSVGLWACRRAEVTAGSRVLITGAGPVGLVTAQCALALGASEVTVTDVNRHRLQLARDLGVTTTVDTGITSLVQAVVQVWSRGCNLYACSGGGFEGDPVVEGLELADVVAPGTFGAEVVVVEVAAEVVEAGRGSDSRCQMMTRMDRATATRALSLPMRLAKRRYRAPRKVLVRPADAAASPSTLLR